MRICYLHIGTEKTGTTAIQKFLRDNKGALSETGVFLPDSIEFPNNRAFPAYFSSSIDEYLTRRGVRSESERTLFFVDFEKVLSEEIERRAESHNRVVITSEHLHSRVTIRENIEKIRNFLDPHFDRIVVICYFRCQIDMAISLYSTIIKVGHTASLEEFCERITPDHYYYNFWEIAENWTTVFGEGNCDFRIFPPAPPKAADPWGDIRKDFLSAIGVDVALQTLSFDSKKENESLSASDVSVYRALNRVFPMMYQKEATLVVSASRKLNSGFRRILGKRRTAFKKIRFANTDEIKSRFAETNEKLFEKYFQGQRYF